VDAKGTVDQRLFRLAFLLLASDDAVAHEGQIWRKEAHSNAINRARDPGTLRTIA